MSITLLDKTRKINSLLHNNSSNKVVFSDICLVLSEILKSNILVISKKGKILACAKYEQINNELIKNQMATYVDKMLNERLLSILSTKENVNLETLGFDKNNEFKAIITPINISAKRLGTLFVYKPNYDYGIEEIILCEYGAIVVGLDMLRSMNEENAEEIRKRNLVKSALSTLSYSEIEAASYIFNELSTDEGILVASKIADRVGITRSVIVNALRKFESAGIIESKSSGMKGTYIKVLNPFIFEELNRIREENK